jgi:hypothetical protein
MESSPSTEYPRLCIEVGLTCEACTGETARQLAQACRGLRGKMIGQMFVQIHPHSACAPMHGRFAEAYRAASSTREGEQQVMFPEMEATPPNPAAPPRRPPARERRKTMAAVA